MEELERRLLEAWDARAEREKAVLVALAFFAVVWFSWSFVIKGNLRLVWAAHKRLATAEAEYKEAVRHHKDTGDFKKKNEDLEAELNQMRVEEEDFNQKIKAQGQLEDVLDGLRREAGKSSLRLVSLDVKTADTAEAAPSKAVDNGAPKKETAYFKRSNISLVYRGPYRQSVEYFLKCMDMHRVMSLTSFSIGKTAAPAARGEPDPKAEAAGAGDSPLETRFELEVLFK